MLPGSAGPTEVLEEGRVRSDIFGYLVEPEQAVAEASNPGVIDVGEAGVRRDVEEDLRRILELDTQQGSFDADPARLEEKGLPRRSCWRMSGSQVTQSVRPNFEAPVGP